MYKQKQPQQRQTQIAQRWHYGSHPLQMRQFSASLPHIRRHKMSIQRHHGNVPPVISAEVLHKMQKTLQIMH